MEGELLTALVAGCVAGWILARRLQLPDLPFHGAWLLALGASAYLLSVWLPTPHMGILRWLFTASQALFLIVFLLNLRLQAFGMMAVGQLANLAVIVANGGEMPVRLPSGHSFPAQLAALVSDPHHQLLTEHIWIPALADTIRRPRLLAMPDAMMSIGDIALCLGAFWLALVWASGRFRTVPDPAERAARQVQ